MERTTYSPVFPDVTVERRAQAQELFGRHVVEHRNRMAALVRKWIESDTKYPVPMMDQLVDRVRKLDPATREHIASISLLMADQIVSAVLAVLDGGDEMKVDDKVVNYALIAQIRDQHSDNICEEVDVNRGKPTIAIWNEYKKWLSRFTPSNLRPIKARVQSIEKK